MAVLSKAEQYEFAERIKLLITFIGLLSDDEVETLEALKKNLKERRSTLHTVGGLLVPLEESDKELGHIEAMIMRIDGVLKINESNKVMQDADEKFAKDKEGREAVMRMFSLGGM